MKPITEFLSTKVAKPSIIKAKNTTIHQIVKEGLDRLGHDADLNYIDVSEVENISRVFSCFSKDLGPTYEDLNPDISQWNVSNVTNMSDVFYKCGKFNCDISQWDVSNVKNMDGMFWNCKKFNQDISSWDVRNVTDMQYMFWDCESFDQDLSGWDVSNVKNHNFIFSGNCIIKASHEPDFD